MLVVISFRTISLKLIILKILDLAGKIYYGVPLIVVRSRKQVVKILGT